MLSKLLGVSGKVMWRDTLKLNIIRGLAGGVAWMVIFLLTILFNSEAFSGQSVISFLFAPVFWPVMYFGMVLPIGLIIGLLFPIKGVTDIIIVLFILPADPLMFILHKKTNLLPPLREPYKFLEFSPIIFVYEDVAA